jgi:hypothetical protein
MARFSNQFIQGLGNPSYGQGLFDLGKNIAGTPMLMRQEKDRKEQQAQVMKILQENSDDAPILNAQSRKYQAQGNDELAKLFSEAAQQAVTKSTRRGEIADESRARADVRAEAVGKKVDAQGAELQRYALEQNATNVAKKMIKDPNQLQATLAGLRGASDEQLRTFLKEASKPKERKTQLMSPGSQLVDTATGNVIRSAPFKPAEPKEPKGVSAKHVKQEDGSVLIYDSNTGDVIQTIKPDTPEKQQGQVQLIDKLVFQENRAQQLIDEASFSDTGLTGGVLSMVPGTDAYDRDAQIVNLKSNLGFDQIEEMKKQAAEYGASGTGLGQISNIEFLSLQSTVDTLKVGMSEEAQIEALNNIKKHLSNIRLITSGVAPKDTVDWNSPTYKERGYAQDPTTGKVFFAPDGPQGDRYELIDGKLVKMRAF